MLAPLIEQWQVMRQAFAPLRLSRWQLTKLFAAQINRDYPVAAKVCVALSLAWVYWIISVLAKPKRLEKQLGIPVVSASKDHSKDFAAVIERGRQMVSTPL